MTDNEIIKVMKLCLSEPCSEQAYINAVRNALFLINRRDAEIESLEIQLHNSKLHERESIEALKNFKRYCDHDTKMSKIEEIKKFAERLKLKVDIDLCEAVECSDYLYNLPKLIDNLVKEMEEDK